MLTFLVSLIASLAIVLGGSDAAYVEAKVTAPAAAIEQPAQQDTAAVTDAWQTVDDLDISNKTDIPMMLDYVSTEEGFPNVPTIHGYFAVSSQDLPNTYHVFKWSTLHTA